MRNYFPVPARYGISGSLDDEGEWEAKLVGVCFIVLGALTIARPVLSELRMGTILLLGALGVPAFPYFTLAGLLVIFLLWRGRPDRSRPAAQSLLVGG